MHSLQADNSYDAIVKGWECQETDRGVPFYIHNSDGKTDWDHPYYTKVIEELDAYQEVQYAAYRTALKLRHLQKKFGLNLLSLQCLQSVLHDHGFPQGCSGVMDSQSLQLILLDVFHTPDFRHFDTFRQDVASELLHNYLLNLFDLSRTGVVKVLSVKLALATLCNSNLSEKYQYFFQEIQSSRAYISRDKLSEFLTDLIQIPDLLRESVAFGKNVAAAVDSCVKVAGTLGDGVPEKGFYAWLMREPQTLIWLPTLHRLAAAETVKHECKCSVCKAMPIVGFRYKCLQCFKFNICQDCFFHGRVAKNHQVRHAIQEYCLPVTAKDETKVFLKVVRNKITRRNRRAAKVAFLPVDNTTDQGLTEWEMRSVPTPPSPPSTSSAHTVCRTGVEGEAASNDSGHSSDQGGEGASTKSAAPPSPSCGSIYDNSNSPGKYLEERQPKRSQCLLQDRHSLIHLVQRLRRENRLLRQQLRDGSGGPENDRETWRSCATAEVACENSIQSQSLSIRDTTQDITDLTHPTFSKTGTELSRTISPIVEMSNTTADQQCYTSDFFNSILGATGTATTATTPGFDVTAADHQSLDAVFASTPAVSTVPALKLGPHKPPRLTAAGDKNIVSLSYILPEGSVLKAPSVPATIEHKAQVHSKLPGRNKSDSLLGMAEELDASTTELEPTAESCDDTKTPSHSTPPPARHEVSVDDIWADVTPCTIRKRISKPTRLASERKNFNSTPESLDRKTRRKSTGSLTSLNVSKVSGVEALATPKSLKRHASLSRLGFQTPGTDKSLFAVSRGDSILKTPERQEIDKMIQWIDDAFPSDLTYSALSLCHDELSAKTHMLKAAENIGHAMADLVQATADNRYK